MSDKDTGNTKRNLSGMKKYPYRNSGKKKELKTAGRKVFSDAKKESIKETQRKPVRARVKNTEPLKRTYYNVPYDFLKYWFIIDRWLRENFSELKRKHIGLLLYFYSEGTFTRTQFSLYHKPLGLYPMSTLNYLVEHGYVSLFRKYQGKNRKALYMVTTKGRLLCSRIHRICMGREEVSLSPKINKMHREDAPKANEYWLELTRRMNKNKPPS